MTRDHRESTTPVEPNIDIRSLQKPPICRHSIHNNPYRAWLLDATAGSVVPGDGAAVAVVGD